MLELKKMVDVVELELDIELRVVKMKNVKLGNCMSENENEQAKNI